MTITKQAPVFNINSDRFSGSASYAIEGILACSPNDLLNSEDLAYEMPYSLYWRNFSQEEDCLDKTFPRPINVCEGMCSEEAQELFEASLLVVACAINQSKQEYLTKKPNLYVSAVINTVGKLLRIYLSSENDCLPETYLSELEKAHIKSLLGEGDESYLIYGFGSRNIRLCHQEPNAYQDGLGNTESKLLCESLKALGIQTEEYSWGNGFLWLGREIRYGNLSELRAILIEHLSKRRIN
jgi:hypothetical protein